MAQVLPVITCSPVSTKTYISDQSTETGSVGNVSQEIPKAKEATFFDDVPIRGPALQDPNLIILVDKVKALSETCFQENCLLKINKKSKWKLAVLSNESSAMFLGFIVYKFNVQMKTVSIAKVAVPEEHRGRGFGRKIVKEVIAVAKKNKQIEVVSLSALPSAIKFYERLRFKAFENIKLKPGEGETDEDFIEGQVYMEFQVRRPRRK